MLILQCLLQQRVDRPPLLPHLPRHLPALLCDILSFQLCYLRLQLWQGVPFHAHTHTTNPTYPQLPPLMRGHPLLVSTEVHLATRLPTGWVKKVTVVNVLLLLI